MPIHSGLSGRKSSSTRQAPKLPQIIQPMSPEEALPASIHAVSGLVHYIQQVLAGPMRGAGPFLRQYLINAQRASNDLLKQLANKSSGTPDLPDSVAQAGVELLALAADHDPELAAELAGALETHCSRTGHEQDEATAAVLAEAQRSKSRPPQQRSSSTTATFGPSSSRTVTCAPPLARFRSRSKVSCLSST